jgi:hypothetical protein
LSLSARNKTHVPGSESFLIGWEKCVADNWTGLSAIDNMRPFFLYLYWVLVPGALIIALPPPTRQATSPPLKKGRGVEPAPLGGAGLSPCPSEAWFSKETLFRGAGIASRP